MVAREVADVMERIEGIRRSLLLAGRRRLELEPGVDQGLFDAWRSMVDVYDLIRVSDGGNGDERRGD